MSTEDDERGWAGVIRAWRAAPDLLPEPEPWRAQAACRGVNPDVFFPDKGQSVARARAICARCPVRDACLEYALAAGSNHVDVGVWGGTTTRERRQIRNARRPGRSPRRATRPR